MSIEEFKKKVDIATDLIISCWDENNPNDGKSFDERLDQVINDCTDETIKRILLNSKNI